jgi:predicted ATP-grasp superfamily ATP-dependent carboligase
MKFMEAVAKVLLLNVDLEELMKETSHIQKRCQKCPKLVKGRKCPSYGACICEIEDW